MPPTTIPFILNIDSGSITANSHATDTFSIGSNEELIVSSFILTSATGNFDLEIHDQAGIAYQQEAVRFEVHDNEKDVFHFPIPLQMTPNTVFKFKFTDVSGATNRVRAKLMCTKNFL